MMGLTLLIRMSQIHYENSDTFLILILFFGKKGLIMGSKSVHRG